MLGYSWVPFGYWPCGSHRTRDATHPLMPPFYLLPQQRLSKMGTRDSGHVPCFSRSRDHGGGRLSSALCSAALDPASHTPSLWLQTPPRVYLPQGKIITGFFLLHALAAATAWGTRAGRRHRQERAWTPESPPESPWEANQAALTFTSSMASASLPSGAWASSLGLGTP